MKRRSIIIGSFIAVAILVLASLPSVVSNQIAKEKQDILIRYMNSMQNANRFKNIELLKEEIVPWEPGILLALLITFIAGTIEAITTGQWFPGMISGLFIFYLILAWLIIFGNSTPDS